MKKLIIVLLTICVLGFITVFIKDQILMQKSKVLPANVSIIAPTPSKAIWKQSTVINVRRTPIRVSWALVEPKQVELYSNLKAKQLSEQIKLDKSCSILVNGGFYSKEYTHLGLFITNFETISRLSQSDTRNGFLWINSNSIFITSAPPDDNPRIAIQSGPLLAQDGKALPLKINSDKPSRRIVAGNTEDNKLIFLVFYQEKSIFEGPMLEQLPEAIELFKDQTKINIVDAINLDGGSASAFISNYDRLDELAHIGSYFCIK